jgi:hypothetical protein
MTKVKKLIVKVGWCSLCQSDCTQGATYDHEKRHNCNDCGYMNRYNDELIEIDPKTNVVVWSSVK